MISYMKKKGLAGLSNIFTSIFMTGFGGCGFGGGAISREKSPHRNGGWDLAITGGSVMDPLSGMDEVATVGIKDGEIVAITTDWDERIETAGRVINARGLVVAPGFINVHGHEGNHLQATSMYSVKDGITTIVGGNCGYMPSFAETMVPVADFFEAQEKEGLYTNFAAYSGTNSLRFRAGVPDEGTAATPEQISKMVEMAAADMASGALGVSMGPGYHPGTTYEEMLALARKTASLGGSNAIHVRYMYPVPSPDLPIVGLEEAIRFARESKAPLLISHIGPFFGNFERAAEMMERARDEGLSLAVDHLAFGDGSTAITAAFLREPPAVSWTVPELLEAIGRDIGDCGVTNTAVIDDEIVMREGERFESVEQFRNIRDLVLDEKMGDPGFNMHFIPDSAQRLMMNLPFCMIGNDGWVMRDAETGKDTGVSHVAGACAHFLGHWVRDEGLFDLKTGLHRAASMPALWFGLEEKGRVQVGCDADLVLFDPDTILDAGLADRSTSLDPPTGIPYVVVNGEVAVDNGAVTGAKPGRIIRKTRTIPGTIAQNP